MSEQQGSAATWDYWKRLQQTGRVEALTTDAVHYGYFRRRVGRKDGKARFQAIGIYPNSAGRVVCEKDGKPTKDAPFDLLFSRSLEGISWDYYMGVTRKGEPWKDAAPDIPASDRVVNREDNAPPDPIAELKAQLVEEQIIATKFLALPIETQDQANGASAFANRVAALGKRLNDEYEKANRPLLEQQKVLRTTLLHPSQEAAALAWKITQHQAPYLAREQRRLDDERYAAERKAFEEQQAREDEQKRLAAEAEAQNRPAPPPVEPAAALPPAQKAASGGLTGRKTTVTTRKVAIITDYRMLAYFCITGGDKTVALNVCRNPDLAVFLQKLADRMAQVATPESSPGFRVEEEPVARR